MMVDVDARSAAEQTRQILPMDTATQFLPLEHHAVYGGSGSLIGRTGFVVAV